MANQIVVGPEHADKIRKELQKIASRLEKLKPSERGYTFGQLRKINSCSADFEFLLGYLQAYEEKFSGELLK